MIILYLSLLILLYPSTTTFSVVGHAGTVSGMYFLWTGRFHIVFWSEWLVIFSELLHCTFFLLRRPHILIGSAQKKYSCQGAAAAMVYASKRRSRLQTFSLIITHSQQPFKWVHLWTQNLSFGFCLVFGILLTANIKAPASFLGNIIISTARWYQASFMLLTWLSLYRSTSVLKKVRQSDHNSDSIRLSSEPLLVLASWQEG